ncbi:DUF3147 family protein [Rugosimonospora africana]|uniref:DUF3147 family protein n=1 Tax=Rugosimonospora africana TaxID=556532 RepID=A0A8J3R4A1_9ACTN|nr:DUF3147 family protein [Rugosimonospora africana]GIH21524.1 hypothetical protein Raf01_96960 [Rugosimonospora africana]
MSGQPAHHGGDEIRVRTAELGQTSLRDWLVRFGFGAGVSALAGTISALVGPTLGGVFLAFPAISLASLTLVAKEDGVRQARNDARGAGLGTLGLLAFAVVIAVTVTRWPLWDAFAAATTAWGLIAFGAYLLAKAVGMGGDESPGL